VLRIEPRRGWLSLDLGELWDFRELLYFLAWRDVKVRYKQTALGVAWAVLQPLLTTVVFTIFFGRLAQVGSDGLPYPLFSFAGLLPWTFFSQGLLKSSESLVGSANLIKKVYFPRLIVPISAILPGLIDSGVSFVVLFAMAAFYGVPLSSGVAVLPLFLFLGLVSALGLGMWLSALNVQYRDVRYVVPFFVQLGLFVTPVIYPASRVLPRLEAAGVPAWVYGLNPMAGVVEGFRWALFGLRPFPADLVGASAAVGAALLLLGAYSFRRMERNFADLV
jgi:lipopolysaccharide transport system permease protein